MGMRRITSARTVLLGVLILTAGVVRASDPPHWSSTSVNIDCTSQCHVPHNSEGGALNSSASNVNLCQSCHRPLGLADPLQINDADKAVRGVGGTSHAFDVLAVNAELNTQLPTDPEMLVRVMDGNVVCSTCHDQHDSVSTFGGTTRIGETRQVTSLGSTGAVVSGGDFTGAQGLWYLVEIAVAGNETSARFRYSKDSGMTWFPADCCPRIEGPCGAIDTSTCTPADGSTPIALGADGVEITFDPGSYAVDPDVGERWEFYAAWPFLRATLGLGGSSLCAECHQSWVMDHNAVRIWDNGSVKSHPVGVTLGVNGQGYDRSIPLDGNGADQGGGGSDSNVTNDLLLFDTGSDVQCLTCHAVHHVDSNTLTVDGP